MNGTVPLLSWCQCVYVRVRVCEHIEDGPAVRRLSRFSRRFLMRPRLTFRPRIILSRRVNVAYFLPSRQLRAANRATPGFVKFHDYKNDDFMSKAGCRKHGGDARLREDTTHDGIAWCYVTRSVNPFISMKPTKLRNRSVSSRLVVREDN